MVRWGRHTRDSRLSMILESWNHRAKLGKDWKSGLFLTREDLFNILFIEGVLTTDGNCSLTLSDAPFLVSSVYLKSPSLIQLGNCPSSLLYIPPTFLIIF